MRKQKLEQVVNRLADLSKKFTEIKASDFKVKGSILTWSVHPYEKSISLHGNSDRDISVSIKIIFDHEGEFKLSFELFDKEKLKYLYPWEISVERNNIPTNIKKQLIPLLSQIAQQIENQLKKRTDSIGSEIEAQFKAWIYAKKEVEPW